MRESVRCLGTSLAAVRLAGIALGEDLTPFTNAHCLAVRVASDLPQPAGQPAVGPSYDAARAYRPSLRQTGYEVALDWA